MVQHTIDSAYFRDSRTYLVLSNMNRMLTTLATFKLVTSGRFLALLNLNLFRIKTCELWKYW